MRSLLISALGIGLTYQSVAAAAAPGERRLQPSSKWVLNYADDSCRLSRSFGKDDEQVIIFMDQFTPGETFRLMLLGKSIKPPPTTLPIPIKGKLQFGPNEQPFEVTGLTATTADLPTYIVTDTIRIAPFSEAEKRAQQEVFKTNRPMRSAPIGAQRELAATSLTVSELLRFDLILETGPMSAPMEALRKCSTDTIRSWGLDVEQQKQLTRWAWPKQDPSSWFSANEYPKDMLRGGNQAIVNFRVIVDESGMPTSCNIQESTRPKAFDDLVCRSIILPESKRGSCSH